MAKIVTQLFYSCIVACVSLSCAIIFNWPSSTLKRFASADTPLHRPMTALELYFFGSISSIAALMVNPLAGYLLDKLGRKYCNMLTAAAYLVFWIMITLSNRVEVVLAAMFVSGLGGSMYLVVPSYVSEMCQESVRGAGTSASNTFYSIGMLITYVLGGTLEYHTMVYVCLAISAVIVLMLGFLKESPVYLMMKGKDEEAAKSLAFFRGIPIDSKEMMQEMDSIRRTLNPQIASTVEEEEKLNPEIEPKKTKLSAWQFFKKSESTRRGLMIVLVLYTLGFMQGLIVIHVYAGPIFAESAPGVSLTLCTTLLAIANIFAGVAASYCVERFGRKSLLMYSSIAAGFGCVLLGSQIQLRWGHSLLTVALVNVCCILFALGSRTVPPVLRIDFFLPEIASILSMVVVEYVWILNFIVLFVFNPLITAIGLGPTFYIFAVVSFVIAAYTALCVPETKGLPIDAVQLLLTKTTRQRHTGA